MSWVKIRSEKWFCTWNGVPFTKNDQRVERFPYKKGQGWPHLGKFHLKQDIDFEGGYLLVSGRISHWDFLKRHWIYGFITLQQICIL